MPRDIPVGNGRLLVTFDAQYEIRDLYFPHVGKENHTSGYACRFGVWVDNTFAWVTGDGWARDLRYVEDTLVTNVRCRHDGLGVELACNDLVDFYENIYMRRIVVRNLTDRPRAARLYFHNDLRISESEIGDTALYDPATRSILHYKGDRYFLASASVGGRQGLDQFATGKKGGGAEGTWRDAEDGNLQGNPIVQGAVDSAFGVDVALAPGGEETVFYWIAAGHTYGDVATLHHVVMDKRPESILKRTENYWRAWSTKNEVDFGTLPAHIVDLYRRSLLVIRTQFNHNGAIIAANDSDITTLSRDTYSYMWPRDGALVAYSLDIAAYSELTRHFFSFCKDLLHRDGYFLHKYTPDGALASSWHPWSADGHPQLPVQEDETALVLWALWKHFDRHRDIEFLKTVYRPMVKPAAEFMVSYRDENGLPKPSWDLWEERFGVHAFTCAAVHAGLRAACRIADFFGETDLTERYQKAADEIRAGMSRFMYLEDAGRFARMVVPDGQGGYTADRTIDASLYGVWYFGTFPVHNPMVISTMQAVEDRLWVKTAVGGVARYENDYYHQVSQDVEAVPGNPWFICTLWLAQYRIARARTLEQLEEALPILEWVASRTLPSGVLAEQIHPYQDQPLSVSPLTWSHATVVATVVEYLKKLEKLVTCDRCGRPLFMHDRKARDAEGRLTKLLGE
jgi:oligosaccharide amylase